ncbi:hypothetical protein WJX84_005303 [Apatococcus fuscideae]|uniref:Uncharacterized protein n=1 Tax=Apatococcus fuscideae TaxID=2026836 RepID=A0AAW1RQL9_9CHLO
MGSALSCTLTPGVGRELLESARRGFDGRVYQILEAQPRLAAHRRTFSRQTCLHIAAASGHLNVIQAIIEVLQLESLMSSTAEDGNTAATDWKAGFRNLADKRDVHGLTALMLASGAGYGRCVALLLAHGASPFILDHGWQSALHHAVGHGRVQVVNILLRDDMKVATDTGLQVLRHVQHKDAKGQSRYIDGRIEYGMTPLYIAILRGHFDCMAALIEAGASVMVRTSSGGQRLSDPLAAGSTPLHAAAAYGSLAMIQTLLQANADAMGTWGGGEATSARQAWEGDRRLDLRCIRNAAEQLPYHVAVRRSNASLPADIIHPGVAVSAALHHIRSLEGGVGPLKLQAIAALALRTSLLAWLLNHQRRMSSAAKHPQPCKVEPCQPALPEHASTQMPGMSPIASTLPQSDHTQHYQPQSIIHAATRPPRSRSLHLPTRPRDVVIGSNPSLPLQSTHGFSEPQEHGFTRWLRSLTKSTSRSSALLARCMSRSGLAASAGTS